MTDTAPASNPTTAAEFYRVYEEHAKALRTWLVAYGIGAPVLLLTNSQLAGVLGTSGNARSVGAAFLLGVALQVLLAALNKAVMWVCYASADIPEKDHGRWAQVATWVSQQFWIDLLTDVLSLTLFAWATWCTFESVVPVT